MNQWYIAEETLPLLGKQTPLGTVRMHPLLMSLSRILIHREHMYYCQFGSLSRVGTPLVLVQMGNQSLLGTSDIWRYQAKPSKTLSYMLCTISLMRHCSLVAHFLQDSPQGAHTHR